MENSATMCGKQKEPESDCTELRALLLFLLLWQAMFKVADRAIVLLLKFFKLFLSGIGKMMQAEVLITLPRSSQKHCSWFEKILAFRRTVLLKMQFALSVKLSIILMNVFAKGQMVRLYQQNAVMWVIHATHTEPERRPCGSILMKAMRSRAGKTFLYPKQVYCFKNVTDSLEDLINKTNFMENCEKWRNSSTQLPDNVLGDCFEGRVWKELQYVDGALSCYIK